MALHKAAKSQGIFQCQVFFIGYRTGSTEVVAAMTSINDKRKARGSTCSHKREKEEERNYKKYPFQHINDSFLCSTNKRKLVST